MDQFLYNITISVVYAAILISMPSIALMFSKKKRFIGVAIFFSLLVVMPAGVFAETVNEKTTIVDLTSEHIGNETTNLANMTENDSNLNTWAYKEPGVFVGAPVKESLFAFSHISKGDWFIIKSTFNFDSSVLMAGASKFLVRLPVPVDFWSEGVLQIFKEGTDLEDLQYMTHFDSQDENITDGNNFFIKNGRAYLKVDCVLHSDINYTFLLSLHTISTLEVEPKLYLTMFDIASDNNNRTYVKFKNLNSGWWYYSVYEVSSPLDGKWDHVLRVDAGWSFIFTEGASSDGVSSLRLYMSKGDNISVDVNFVNSLLYPNERDCFSYILPFNSDGGELNFTISLINKEYNFTTGNFDYNVVRTVTSMFTNYFIFSTNLSTGNDSDEIVTHLNITYNGDKPVSLVIPVRESDGFSFVREGTTWYVPEAPLSVYKSGFRTFFGFEPFAGSEVSNSTLLRVVGLPSYMYNTSENLTFSFFVSKYGMQLKYLDTETNRFKYFLAELQSTTTKGPIQWIVDGAINVAKSFVSWVGNGLSWLGGKIMDALQWIWNGLMGIGKWIYTNVMRIFTAIKWFVEQVINFIAYLLGFLLIGVALMIFYFGYHMTVAVWGVALMLSEGRLHEAADVAKERLKNGLAMLKRVRGG